MRDTHISGAIQEKGECFEMALKTDLNHFLKCLNFHFVRIMGLVCKKAFDNFGRVSGTLVAH